MVGAGNEEDGGPGDGDFFTTFLFLPVFHDVTTEKTGGTLGINWGADNANDQGGQPGDRSVQFANVAIPLA